jgi:hypothetical protein
VLTGRTIGTTIDKGVTTDTPAAADTITDTITTTEVRPAGGTDAGGAGLERK